MPSQSLTIRTTITSRLKRYVVLRGAMLAGLGGCILVFSGIFLKAPLLQIWGLPLLILGGALIAWGLFPYRKLAHLENNPNRINVSPDDCLDYFVKGKQKLHIPLQSIEKMEYVEHPYRYGILVMLKDPRQTIFLPYFSQRSFNEMDKP